MIKGCAKRVVVVRDIESNFFEEAFFIVKQTSGTAKAGTGDFINEANRIVRNNLPEKNIFADSKSKNTKLLITPQKKSAPRTRKRIIRDALMFVFGFGVSAVICTAIYYSGIGV